MRDGPLMTPKARVRKSVPSPRARSNTVPIAIKHVAIKASLPAVALEWTSSRWSLNGRPSPHIKVVTKAIPRMQVARPAIESSPANCGSGRLKSPMPPLAQMIPSGISMRAPMTARAHTNATTTRVTKLVGTLMMRV